MACTARPGCRSACTIAPFQLLTVCRAAPGIAGGGRVEVLELGGEVQSVPEDAIDLDPACPVCQLDWTPDGQILTVAAQVPAAPRLLPVCCSRRLTLLHRRACFLSGFVMHCQMPCRLLYGLLML